MLIGVGWVGAWGGACYRSLLLEHNAHWGGVGWGVGHGVGRVTVPRVQAIHFPRVQASQISRVQPMHRPENAETDHHLGFIVDGPVLLNTVGRMRNDSITNVYR